MRGSGVIDGFWLPKAVRSGLIARRRSWVESSFAGGRECGRECDAGTPGAVTARWLSLTEEHWEVLLDGLAAARDRAPRGPEFWERLKVAMGTVARGFADPKTPARRKLETIPAYTGYSPAMIGSVMAAPEIWDLEQMTRALSLDPTKAAKAGWQPLSGLPGRLRFFPSHAPGIGRLTGRVPLYSRRSLFGAPETPEFVTGYGAGNVPGTALIIVLLALSTTLGGGAPPVVLVRNSRREPIFSPLILEALEKADEDLVSTVAVLVWDYDDAALQSRLLGRSDLVIAAAGDDAIASIAGQIPRERGPSGRSRVRFHPHGHKVSFTAIGREIFELGRKGAHYSWEGGLVGVVALLAGLDSIFWDQNGCLSSRIHFVERSAHGDTDALEYADLLVRRLRRLSEVLPRGAWPLRQLRDSFDRYKALESSGGVPTGLQVLSDYDDPFVVILDERAPDRPSLSPRMFGALVNDCQGRVVIVRPVEDLMEIPRDYLSLLPARSLQSLSVAAGRPGEGLSHRFLDFAAACGERGVTAIRVVGRGAFPQLAYSWDGLLPLDLVRRRPAGHFTTVEFDRPFDAMMETYRSFVTQMAGSVARPVGERPPAGQ
jgi:Acyl-CoA reductase (LuxC)